VPGPAPSENDRRRVLRSMKLKSRQPTAFHFCSWPPSSIFWHSSRNVWPPTLLHISWESGPEMSGDRSRERRRLAAKRLIFAKQMDDWRIRASVLGMTQRWLDLAQPREPVASDKALRLRAIQTNIGRELRAQFDLPREMPYRILTLLIQIGAPQDRESGATPGKEPSRIEVPYSKTQCLRAGTIQHHTPSK